ncbi:bifunctional diguanylate cyclase/phosphodiesterase [Shewanella donghaensis]|uniref:bifunctional diguanylate cyclase/phosphodiesterase n=1 Tax=Shewanella donghaensis TaxID=238836 RepID=UPI001181F590|nr:bifunctional diguanylate cyclase/phosphodiesterase [Shewanella donghaensis]
MKLRRRIDLILLPAITVVFFTFSFLFYQTAKNYHIDAILSSLTYQFEQVANSNKTNIAAIENMLNYQLQSQEAVDLFNDAKDENIDIRISTQFLNRLTRSTENEFIQDIVIYNIKKQPISYINFDDPFVDVSMTASTELLINQINTSIQSKSRKRIFANHIQISTTKSGHSQIQLYRVFSPFLLVSEPLYSYTDDLVIIQTRLKDYYLTHVFRDITNKYTDNITLDMFQLPLTENGNGNERDVSVDITEKDDSYHFGVLLFNGRINAILDKDFFTPALTDLKFNIILSALALSLFCFLVLHLLIYKNLIRPVTMLANSVNGMQKGDNMALKPLSRNDEVSDLNNSYIALIERIQQLANNDELTGLSNRAYFNRILEQKIDSSSDCDGLLGLLFIDLDNFKSINDNFGHKAGDSVLVNFAQRLTSTLRKSSRNSDEQENQFIARLGGDEFVVLIEGISDVKEIEAIAQRIVDIFEFGLKVNDKNYDVHASIGIAFQSGTKIQAEAFLQQADTAMYAAKHGGKNNFCTYNESLDNQLKEYKYIESEVIKALRDKSLYLVFLPVYNTNSMEVISFDVLLRAPELDKKGIGPDTFISIAEKTDLITKIDLWVIEESFIKLNNLIDLHEFDGTLSINISSRELFNDNFVEDVSSLMQKYHIPPYRVIFEIAETPLLASNEKVLVNLAKLKALGIKLAIDGFGGSYTAFTYLRHYPMDSLKIDRSFLAQMNDVQAGDKPLIDIIYDLAKIHSIDVVIEGVQSEQELNYVKKLGCNTVQGFYLSKPLEWHQAQALVNKTNISYFPSNKNRS